MAISLTSAQTWAHDPTQFNIRSVDAALRSDGTIVMAYAGTDATLDARLSFGTLNGAAGLLTNISTTLYPQAIGGFPAAVITSLDIEAGPGGRVAVQLRMNEAGLTADTNAALLVQRFNGTALAGSATEVNPTTPTDATSDYSALVYGAKGGFAVFFTETTVAGGLSNGIRMAQFSPTGASLGAPLTVIADHVAGGLIASDANPVFVDAAAMGSGYGVTWTESSAFAAPGFGQPKVMFQAVSSAGVAQGVALEIDGTSAQKSQIVALTSGRMAVVWLDTTPGDQGVYKGQILSASGAKLGGVFEISSTVTTQETDLSLAATADGGFAAVWRDMSNQSFLGRMFTDRGAAKGNDFAILDTAGQFIGGKAGLLADGTTLYTFMHGLNGTVGAGFVLQGQAFDTASSWGKTVDGTSANDTLTGGALDDILSGAGGRDQIRGQDGNDILNGGQAADILTGGSGRDQLTGGVAADRLTGGAGADSFVFTAATDGGDTITDFNGAEGDRLILSLGGFGGVGFVSSGAVFNPALRGLFFNTTSGVLTYDADGSGSSAVQTIATLTGVTTLAFDDTLFVS